MNKLLLFGLNNNEIKPLYLCNSGCIVSSNVSSNNKPAGDVDGKILLCGLHNNELIPLLVNDDGELL